MATSRDFAFKYLLAIERKHQEFFKENKINVFDCVDIIGHQMVTVEVAADLLPAEIKYDIEMMFWK